MIKKIREIHLVKIGNKEWIESTLAEPDTDLMIQKEETLHQKFSNRLRFGKSHDRGKTIIIIFKLKLFQI